MGEQEFSTELTEMLMGLMSAGLKAMVQRFYEMLMSMEVNNKLKERLEMRGQKSARATAAKSLEACAARFSNPTGASPSARWGHRKRRWESAA